MSFFSSSRISATSLSFALVGKLSRSSSERDKQVRRQPRTDGTATGESVGTGFLLRTCLAHIPGGGGAVAGRLLFPLPSRLRGSSNLPSPSAASTAVQVFSLPTLAYWSRQPAGRAFSPLSLFRDARRAGRRPSQP